MLPVQLRVLLGLLLVWRLLVGLLLLLLPLVGLLLLLLVLMPMHVLLLLLLLLPLLLLLLLLSLLLLLLLLLLLPLPLLRRHVGRLMTPMHLGGVDGFARVPHGCLSSCPGQLGRRQALPRHMVLGEATVVPP